MNIGKPRKLGKTINEIEEGDSLSLTESIEDNQLLLYLGLTNDANPLYIQHDFAQKTEYHQPIVPSLPVQSRNICLDQVHMSSIFL